MGDDYKGKHGDLSGGVLSVDCAVVGCLPEGSGFDNRAEITAVVCQRAFDVGLDVCLIYTFNKCLVVFEMWWLI